MLAALGADWHEHPPKQGAVEPLSRLQRLFREGYCASDAPTTLQRPPSRGKEEEMAMSGKDELTPRERDVLELVKRFWTNSEIARGLGIGERTVETHVAHVLDELGYKDRRDLWRDAIG